MFDSKRPKFNFSLTINEINNIPHTAGYCYVQIHIGESSSSGIRSVLGSWKESKDLNTSSSEKSSTSGNSSKYTSSQNHVDVRTPSRKVTNFRAVLNFHMNCNLRFVVGKRDNMVENKMLRIRVFYVPEKHNKLSTKTTELGNVTLNLAEYLDSTKPVAEKHLLQNSKINSILSLRMQFEELAANFDFHTALKIEDHKHGLMHTSQLMGKSELSRTFKTPQALRKKGFTGIDTVINSSTTADSPKAEDASDAALQQSEQKDAKKEARQIGTSTYDNVLVDPIVSNLYRKIMESTWDPELHVLLKYSPEKIIDDIFLEKYQKDIEILRKDFHKYYMQSDGGEEDAFRDLNGLINEVKVRENLRSWNVPLH